MEDETQYLELKPSEDLKDLVHSFWTHRNFDNKPEPMTIFPDSFFKIVFLVREGKILNYFMTGLWTNQKEFAIPANTSSFGCRFRILAPEFLFKHEIASLLDSIKQLDISYLNARRFDFSDFETTVAAWQEELRKIRSDKPIEGNKLRLSQLLYEMDGSITAAEVSNQIFWSNRQINRYLNKYLGVSLKKYLNIQKCYMAYLQIRDGEFFPEKDFFDQPHFIKEVKKHTGETPKSLYSKQNDRFIQLKNIRQK